MTADQILTRALPNLTISSTSSNSSTPSSSSSFSSSSSNFSSIWNELSTDHPTSPNHHVPTDNSYLPLIPDNVIGIPNFFKYEYQDAMWSVRVALPLALLLQTTGHILVVRVWKRSNKKRCDSLVLVLNYIAADTIFVLYIITVFSLEITTCMLVQIFYNVSVTMPISAVCLITLKRFIRVVKPLRCCFIMTKSRELVLVTVSWTIVLIIAILNLFKWCVLLRNLEIDYCYYSTPTEPECWCYLALQIVVYFVVPVLSVLVMYGVMLRESRKAFQREALVSFINMNRRTDYKRRSTGTTIINFNVTNNITLDSDKPCRFSVRHKVQGRFVLENTDGEGSGDDAIVMSNIDEGAVDSDTTSGASNFSNTHGRGQSSRSSPGTSTPSSGKSSNKVDNHDLGKFKPTAPRLLQKRLSDANSFSVHGTIMIMLCCFFVRSLPWIPQILTPSLFFPGSDNLAVMEGLTLLQCVGIASCPYIFLLTSTTKIRRFLHTLSVAAVNSVTGKTRRSKVSPAQFDFSDG